MLKMGWLRTLLSALMLAPAIFAQTGARPNLKGEVMILVYHNFGTADGRWARSYDSFDHDLERLDAAGYRPVTLHQLVTGDYVLPAGTTPVVLTFDDGSANQVKFTPDGQLSNDSAVGRWVAFAKTHPEFPVHGVFFINPGTDIFGQKAYQQAKLELLVKLGSEIGNHTMTHPYLNKLAVPAIEREIGEGQYRLEQRLPGTAITSFALPFGIAPKPPELAWTGEWQGTVGGHSVDEHWNYEAVVLVGANPAPSPYSAQFQPHHLPRVQVFTPEFDRWMTFFETHPGLRFRSDGEKHLRAQ